MSALPTSRNHLPLEPVAPNVATSKKAASTDHRGPERDRERSALGPPSLKVSAGYLALRLEWPPRPVESLACTEALIHLRHWTPEGRDTLARILRRTLERNGARR